MKSNNALSIDSTIELKFKDSTLRDISYNSYLPEYSGSHRSKSNRSKSRMEKSGNSLIFYIESKDITAFRASVNDIVGFGKVIENCLKLCE